jgi:hypothetical protein
VGRNLRDSLRNASDQAATAEKITRIPIPDKAAAGAIALTDRVKSYWSAWYRINGQVSDGQRGLAFLSNIDAGDDFATAAEKVTRNMYDYTDLTRAERRLRLLIPFYTFVKNSFVHQAKLMLQRPAYANSFTKLRQNIEEMLVGEERIPDHLRPAWMREQMAIQVAKDPSKSWAVLPLTLLPADAIIQTAQSIMGVEAAQEFMHYFTSNVNPILKAPVEFGVGREFFSGREIGPDPLRGDIGAAEFALQQIRPFREFGVGGIRQGPVPRAFDKSVAQGLARLTVGGRVQAFDQERREFALQRQFDDEVRRLRKAISVARREGADQVSLKARVKLLQIYREMRDSGLEIPRWAERQLSELERPAQLTGVRQAGPEGEKIALGLNNGPVNGAGP